MIYIVMGYKHSGTSLLSSLLHKSGIPMYLTSRENIWSPDDYSYEYYEDNWENLIEVEIANHSIPKARKLLDIQNYTEFRESYHSSDWGVKLSNNVSYWKFWNIALSSYDYKLIGVYRHPEASIGQGVKLGKRDYDKLLSEWISQNRHLIRFLQKEDDYLLVNYEELLKLKELSPIANFTNHEITNTIEESKRHFKSDEIPDRCKKIWSKLREIDNYNKN